MRYDRFQLPLPFQHQPRFDARDFIPAWSNREALAWLETEWPDRRLALFGPEGCGKSHLLHIWARRTGAAVLSGPALTDLDCLPPNGALVLDDGDTVRDETLLFHLLNTARDRELRLLLSGRAAPSRWPVRLPDLTSRLRAIAAVEVRQPDDELLAALLMRLIAERQLSVTQTVQDWLLLRLPRSPAALCEVVARLDRESLVSGTAITRPLAARILKDFPIVDSWDSSMPDVAPSSSARGFL
jgi:DnaA regulatory inactivator Hda